jgi:hypothetical protein
MKTFPPDKTEHPTAKHKAIAQAHRERHDGTPRQLHLRSRQAFSCFDSGADLSGVHLDSALRGVGVAALPGYENRTQPAGARILRPGSRPMTARFLWGLGRTVSGAANDSPAIPVRGEKVFRRTATGRYGEWTGGEPYPRSPPAPASPRCSDAAARLRGPPGAPFPPVTACAQT